MQDDSLSRLIEKLAADGVCTAAQAVRGCGQEALKELLDRGLARVVRVPYRLTARSRHAVPAPVVLLTAAGERAAREQGLDPYRPPLREIAHALGVAEMRAALGLPARQVVRSDRIKAAWARAGAPDRGLPDILCWTGSELVALEYDHGKYSPGQVRQKLGISPFLCDRMVWGAPTPSRVEWLRSHGAREVLVVRVPLWPGN